MEQGLRDRTSTLRDSRSAPAAPRARERATDNQCIFGFPGAGFSSGSTRPSADSLLDIFGPGEKIGRSSKMNLLGETRRGSPRVADTRSVGGFRDAAFVELWTIRINLRLAQIESLQNFFAYGKSAVPPYIRKRMKLRFLNAGRRRVPKLSRKKFGGP